MNNVLSLLELAESMNVMEFSGNWTCSTVYIGTVEIVPHPLSRKESFSTPFIKVVIVIWQIGAPVDPRSNCLVGMLPNPFALYGCVS